MRPHIPITREQCRQRFGMYPLKDVVSFCVYSKEGELLDIYDIVDAEPLLSFEPGSWRFRQPVAGDEIEFLERLYSL